MTRTARPPWLGIELRHLAALSAVARESSFRAAAERLGYVQSAISQQLAHLEELVGVRLVDRRRGTSHVELTEAGELLLHHIDAILARFNAAQADIEALQAGRAGQLRVGVYEPVASKLMPPMLIALARRLPAVEVQIEEARADDLAIAVERGELDVAFGDLPLPAGSLQAKEVRSDPYVLLVPADWPVAAREEPPSPEELARMPLIGEPRGRAGERIDVALRARGVEPQYALRSGSHTAVQALIAAGMGAAIVPRLNVDERDDRTVVVELGDLIPPRVIALHWHGERRHSPALDTFVEVAVAACREPTRDRRAAPITDRHHGVRHP